MAKRDISGRAGSKVRLDTNKFRRLLLEKSFQSIDREQRVRRQAQPGAREMVLMAYNKRTSKDDAYLAIKVFNDKIGREVYSREVVDRWILEYHQSAVRKMFNEGR